jgi:hypothetical protein
LFRIMATGDLVVDRDDYRTQYADLHIGSVASFLSRKPETCGKDYPLQYFPMERRELSSHQLNPIMLVRLSIAIHVGAMQVPL